MAVMFFFFFFNDTATTEIYTLSLHDALPIFVVIDVTEYGLFLRFGRVVRVVTEPGLSVKRPFPLETVVRFDKRLLTLDRKSTRLNSSHLVISYAVFCLKKKNSITERYHSSYQ